MVAGPDVAEVLENPNDVANSRLARKLEQSLDESARQALSAR